MKKVLKQDNIKQIAEEIIIKVSNTNKEEATILAISGDLGAGKTTLTQELAKYLGVKDNIVSPTFVIMKIYKTRNLQFKNLIHIDAYRLDKSQELLSLGWDEFIKDKNNLIVVEWPEKVPECMNIIPVHSIDITHIDETTRNIKF